MLTVPLLSELPEKKRLARTDPAAKILAAKIRHAVRLSTVTLYGAIYLESGTFFATFHSDYVHCFLLLFTKLFNQGLNLNQALGISECFLSGQSFQLLMNDLSGFAQPLEQGRILGRSGFGQSLLSVRWPGH